MNETIVVTSIRETVDLMECLARLPGTLAQHFAALRDRVDHWLTRAALAVALWVFAGPDRPWETP